MRIVLLFLHRQTFNLNNMDKFGISKSLVESTSKDFHLMFYYENHVNVCLSVFQLMELNRVLSVYRTTVSSSSPLVLDEIINVIQSYVDSLHNNV